MLEWFIIAKVIYNVSVNKKNKIGSSLIKESITEFSNIDGVQYFSIWQKKISKNKVYTLLESIKTYENKIIDFDADFEINEDDDNLYCSEFVYFILNKAGVLDVEYKPTVKELKGMYKNILGDSLEYIPVDFFQFDTKFIKIFEKTFKP